MAIFIAISRTLAFIFIAGLASYALGAPYGGADYVYEQDSDSLRLGELLTVAIVLLLGTFVAATARGAAILSVIFFACVTCGSFYLVWMGIDMLSLEREGAELVGFGAIGMGCLIFWTLVRSFFSGV